MPGLGNLLMPKKFLTIKARPQYSKLMPCCQWHCCAWTLLIIAKWNQIHLIWFHSTVYLLSFYLSNFCTIKHFIPFHMLRYEIRSHPDVSRIIQISDAVAPDWPLTAKHRITTSKLQSYILIHLTWKLEVERSGQQITSTRQHLLMLNC